MSECHQTTQTRACLFTARWERRGEDKQIGGQIDRQELVQQAHTHRLTSDLKSQIIADNVLRNYSRVTV